MLPVLGFVCLFTLGFLVTAVVVVLLAAFEAAVMALSRRWCGYGCGCGCGCGYGFSCDCDCDQ